MGKASNRSLMNKIVKAAEIEAYQIKREMEQPVTADMGLRPAKKIVRKKRKRFKEEWDEVGWMNE